MVEANLGWALEQIEFLATIRLGWNRCVDRWCLPRGMVAMETQMKMNYLESLYRPYFGFAEGLAADCECRIAGIDEEGSEWVALLDVSMEIVAGTVVGIVHDRERCVEGMAVNVLAMIDRLSFERLSSRSRCFLLVCLNFGQQQGASLKLDFHRSCCWNFRMYCRWNCHYNCYFRRSFQLKSFQFGRRELFPFDHKEYFQIVRKEYFLFDHME